MTYADGHRTTNRPPGLERIATAVILLVVTGLGPATASAFERTKTCTESGLHACGDGEDPKPIYWPTRCTNYWVEREGSADFSDGSTSQIGEELRNLVRVSFDVWNDVACSDFTMQEAGLTETGSASFDQNGGIDGNDNVVVWLDDDWPYASQGAYAFTSVSYSSESGQIADADIELNGETYDFSELAEADDQGDTIDLRNTLVHEIGHYVGLAHTDVEEATMYGSADPGEIKKRTLHQDDIDGICAAYPAGESPVDCDAPDMEMDAGGTGNDAGMDAGMDAAMETDTSPDTPPADTSMGVDTTGAAPDGTSRPDTGTRVGDVDAGSDAASAPSGNGNGDGCAGCSTGGRSSPGSTALWSLLLMVCLRTFGRRLLPRRRP